LRNLGKMVKESFKADKVLLATYICFELDGEKGVLMESYCRHCKNKTVKLFTTKIKRLICTGCGKEKGVASRYV